MVIGKKNERPGTWSAGIEIVFNRPLPFPSAIDNGHRIEIWLFKLRRLPKRGATFTKGFGKDKDVRGVWKLWWAYREPDIKQRQIVKRRGFRDRPVDIIHRGAWRLHSW